MKKVEIKKLDKLFREIIKEEYSNKCIICGKTDYLNVHHVEGRRIKSLRWYLPNGVLLCSGHHTFGMFSAHQSPMRMRKELVDIFGTKWERDILKKSNLTFKGTFQTVQDYLEGKKDYYC